MERLTCVDVSNGFSVCVSVVFCVSFVFRLFPVLGTALQSFVLPVMLQSRARSSSAIGGMEWRGGGRDLYVVNVGLKFNKEVVGRFPLVQHSVFLETTTLDVTFIFILLFICAILNIKI
jgi:hypothetical protein